MAGSGLGRRFLRTRPTVLRLDGCADVSLVDEGEHLLLGGMGGGDVGSGDPHRSGAVDADSNIVLCLDLADRAPTSTDDTPCESRRDVECQDAVRPMPSI